MTPRVLNRHAVEVAPRLLGALLVSDIDGERVSVRVTEVEAYGGVGEDAGSHAFRRRTARNASMFGDPGHAYVYFTYGMHWCVNVVTRPTGVAGAVLLRAGQVVEGLEVARRRRGLRASDRDLARGPARLCAALGVTGDLDGVDLFGSDSVLRLALSRRRVADVQASARTGVGGAGASIPWRFFIPHEPSVSPYRAVSVSRRAS